MRKIHFYLLLCIVVFATGCPKYKPSVDFNNPTSLVNRLNDKFAKVQDRYWCYRYGFNYVGGAGNPCSGTVQNGPKLAEGVRNEFIESALPFLDDAYTDYIISLQAGQDRTNFIADVVELGTSAAVGITNGERPLQILGIALTAFRGGRRSADLNFYKEQTVPILISKMDGNRAKVRATILNREKSGVDDYPIGAAISDIVDYYNAGTLVRAFTELQKDTAVQTKQSEEEVLELKGIKRSTPATRVEAEEAKEALAVLRTLNASLNDAQTQADAVGKLHNIVKALEDDPETARLVKLANITSMEQDGAKLLNGLRKIKRDLGPDPIQRKINQAIIANGK